VALVVGSLLFAINHGSAVLREMTRERWLMGLVPYGQYSWTVLNPIATQKPLPAENPTVGVSENPSMPKRDRTAHLDWVRKNWAGAQSWQDAGQQGLTPTSRTNPGASD